MQKKVDINIDNLEQPTRLLLYQCPLCKELTLLHNFKTDHAGITICCKECGKSFFYAAPTTKSEPAVSALSSTSQAAQQVNCDSLYADEEPIVPSSTKNLLQNSINSSELDASSVSLEFNQRIIKKVTQDTLTSSISKPDHDQTEERCPKCCNPRRTEWYDCPNCGLHFANIGVTYIPHNMSNPQNQDEEIAWSMWNNILDSWTNEAQHENFMQYCMTHDLLEFAASRYRLLKSEDNWRTEKSEFYLSKIIDMAQHQFLFRQQESIPMSNRVGVWKIVLVLILLGFGFLAFYIIWRTAFNVPSQTILP